ncbi:hypothetical protein D3C87_1502780 [compost metagenome]
MGAQLREERLQRRDVFVVFSNCEQCPQPFSGVEHRMVHELHSAGEKRLRRLRRLCSATAHFTRPLQVRFSLLEQEDCSYTSNGRLPLVRQLRVFMSGREEVFEVEFLCCCCSSIERE